MTHDVHHRSLLLATGAVVLLGPGSAPAAGQDPGAADRDAAASGDAVDAYVERLHRTLGSDPAEIREGLGTPDSVRVEVRENRYYRNHDDASVTLHFPGVTVSLRYVARSGEELLSGLTLSTPERTCGLPVGVGDPVETVIGELGPPAEAEGDVVRYLFGVATSELEFRVREDTVTGVHLDYYLE